MSELVTILSSSLTRQDSALLHCTIYEYLYNLYSFLIKDFKNIFKFGPQVAKNLLVYKSCSFHFE